MEEINLNQLQSDVCSLADNQIRVFYQFLNWIRQNNLTFRFLALFL